VNLFHSRVHAGFARIGELELETPEYADTNDTAALAYVRPHDITIHRTAEGGDSAFKAVVSFIQAIGPIVRLELQREDDSELVEAEITRERFRELDLRDGETVFIKPRAYKVFLNEAVAVN
jgi:sulfate transport system ATP-binding protein